MADRLTQLQDCLDDLLTQMYASLSYIRQRHPYGVIEGQPSQAPQAQPAFTNGNAATSNPQKPEQQNGNQNTTEPERPQTPPPEDPQIFNAALHELARDLVIKEQQMEYIINNLPGIGNSEADQERRIRELGEELKDVEAERAKAEVERGQMIEALGKVIVGTKKVP